MRLSRDNPALLKVQVCEQFIGMDLRIEGKKTDLWFMSHNP